MDLPETWLATDSQDSLGHRLCEELMSEVGPGHPLFGHRVEPLAKCGHCDDAIFRVDDGTWARVHLSWTGKPDTPPWPTTARFGSLPELEADLADHSR